MLTHSHSLTLTHGFSHSLGVFCDRNHNAARGAKEFTIAFVQNIRDLPCTSLAVIFVGKCETVVSHIPASSQPETRKWVWWRRAGDGYEWWNSRETAMIGQICGKVAVFWQNCKVTHNSQGLVEFALIVAIATSWRDWTDGKQWTPRPS